MACSFDAIAAGTFRHELFYRLNVVPILAPPLREPTADIPLPVEYFVDRCARKAGKSISRIAKRTLELFKTHSWPGNIRELQNVVERATIVCEGDAFLIDESWLKPQSPPRNATAEFPDPAGLQASWEFRGRRSSRNPL
jgi:transcriptional regulator with PAS, ATPase and Fis domain